MILLIRVCVVLFSVLFVKSEIYLRNTNDGVEIESYDCVLLQSFFYCRRPRQPIDLTRDDDTMKCEQNDGQLHRFSELQSKNISISIILHQWKSSLERVEQYSHYLRNSSEPDGYLCECLHSSAFGKNCEYQLPIGKSFPETLDRQMGIRNKNRWKVQIYGDVVCYETLKCDSGVLCLDWREICDGTQQCMPGIDEENCDLLEMNRCDDDEYRCENGMCIPDQFFLDGEFDCLDWSDEMQFKKSENCPKERVNTKCDDHICLAHEWSCGDGECIRDRLDFQKSIHPLTYQSGRDQFFMCETHRTAILWTMLNGRCYGDGDERYQGSAMTNSSIEDQCECLLKCSLLQDRKDDCSCYSGAECATDFEEVCPPMIRYPNGAIVAPFLFFFFNRTRNWQNKLPDVILINGTVRCGDSMISVIKKIIPFEKDLNPRQMVEDYFCRPSRSISRSEQRCQHENDSTDRCQEWNSCMSKSRINDGWLNCQNKQDEIAQTEMETKKSCAQVWRHRFHCSIEQPTCLSVRKLGDSGVDCRNKFDQWWFRDGREIASISCNNQGQDECSLLRQYIEQSWTSIWMNQSEMRSENRISFRSYCDTFWDLESSEDENLFDCKRSWICPERRWRCGTGQCFRQPWRDDGEWDCADGSDEHLHLKRITESALRAAFRHDFTNRSYFVPNTCNQTHPFFCLSSTATQQGFSCFNFSQIGDGRIDCAGAIDEQMTLRHCSQLSVLGPNFQCSSTKTCIPYYLHCLPDYRCPNRSDDELWCSRQYQSSNCSGLNGFTCFDGRCLKRGRCNLHPDCPFGEDEYMCDYASSSRLALAPHREVKRFVQRMTKHTVRLSPYPTDANATKLIPDSISIIHPSANLSSTHLLFSPYWCNRGLGILTTNNHSIVCFCPPHYYGDKCEYHADRLSVLLHLNLSRSIYLSERDSVIVLKLLVLFLFNNQTLMRDEFQLRSASKSTPIDDQKIITHFLYSRSTSSLEERRKRFFNRSNLLYFHPYSIRIELYETLIDKRPSLIAVWKYPIFFDYLPVFRFAKVLHFTEFSDHQNPCSSQPCYPNEQCQPLMNNKSQYICLCKTNFTGENCSEENQHCLKGYCSKGSLCQPNSRTSLRGDSSLPFCLCPLNRFGDRCSIEHDQCLFNPCLNNGSCVSNSQPDQVICLCTRKYCGPQCQWKRPSIHLSLSNNIPHHGAVIQFLQIGLISLDFILVGQQVFKTLPPLIEYFQYDDQKAILPDIVLAKIYSSHEDLSSPDLYLLSLYRSLHLFSLHGTTQISPINRCEHLRTFSNGNSSLLAISPEII